MDGFSPYILAALLGWVIAQGSKYVIQSIKHRSFKKNLRQLYMSGNMPSAHSATTVALLVVVGGLDGVNSAVFGLALLFTSVVMYDAVMVRRSSGEQGKVILALLAKQKSDIKPPHVAKGHTPMEVLVGAVLGWIVGMVVLLATS